MRLQRVEIEGYRSIRNRVEFHVDPNVTVLLGANDHGKTNILNAVRHLNPDVPFKVDLDLNWDRPDQARFPEIVWHFVLDDREHRELVARVRSSLAEPADKKDEPAETTTAQPTGEASAQSAPAEPVHVLEQVSAELEPSVGRELRVTRRGIAGVPEVQVLGVPTDLALKFWTNERPRVVLIKAQESLPDAVTFDDLKKESHEFMRGIFYYAGLDPEDCKELFTQNDATMMKLKQASAKLNETLRSNWSQGRNLRYELAHDSMGSQILLRIEDPAVQNQLVRASRRSSGFTHFFTLKTILHARKTDWEASAYLFLFDEPGIYLHPSGQYDLLKVLDDIGQSNQVMYSTHSLFMINKTFPVRHRLIAKTDQGTVVDQKPFVGRWGAAIEALGFSLAGTILFAQYVLLAEGDADPMLIEFLFQRLAAEGLASVDLNAFSVISTGESQNTDALIRILKEGANGPKLLVLVDGDKGGKDRLKKLKAVLDGHQVKGVSLGTGLEVEDYLPAAGQLYPQAVSNYVIRLAEMSGVGRTAEEIHAAVKAAASSVEDGSEGLTCGIGGWGGNAGKTAGSLTSKPSKVGIAREYIELAASAKFTSEQLARGVALLQLVQSELEIPSLEEALRRAATTDEPSQGRA